MNTLTSENRLRQQYLSTSFVHLNLTGTVYSKRTSVGFGSDLGLHKVSAYVKLNTWAKVLRAVVYSV